MEPAEALHFHILRRSKEGVEDWIDRGVEELARCPMLNDVLLPAMKEVGDRFGAGELILPFVLQSAEVMKRAVARLEQYLDRLEGHTKGTVVLATVFGDVHDIGKSLVNTILTNNGYSVVDLGKQVPIGTILDAAARARRHRDRALGAARVDLAARCRCASRAARAGAWAPRCSSAARRSTATSACARCTPAGASPRTSTSPASSTARTPSTGCTRWTSSSSPTAATRWSSRVREAARKLRDRGPEPDRGRTDDDSVRSAARTDVPVPAPPWWGRREVDVELDDVFHHLDTHVLFKLHWGGKGVKGEAWRRLLEDDFLPRLERMWREQDYLHPRARARVLPVLQRGQRARRPGPRAIARRSSSGSCSRASRATTGSAWRTSSGRGRHTELDVVALQAVTAGDQVTELMAELEREGEFAEQLFMHGIGVQTAEGMAEWLHAPVRDALGIPRDQGRRYSWGYPACPEQSEHEKVFRLLDAPAIGLRLSGGFAVEPEQSTLAVIAHHPQAVYFGMKSGFLPKDGAVAPDELIAGTARDPERAVTVDA